MKFFKNIRLAQKVSLLSASFLVFLAVIGFAAIRQIDTVNSKIMELNDSRLAPIVELESIKSDIEYIRAQVNSIMDAEDDSSKRTIQDNIQARVVSSNRKLSGYKDNDEYKKVIDSYNDFLTAKDNFIKARGAGTVQEVPNGQPSSDSQIRKGAPTEIANMDTTREAVISALDTIINKHISDAKQTYEDSKTVYKNTLYALISLIVVCAAIIVLLSIVIIRSITLPVKSVTQKLEEISQSNGDLTQRIGYESKDEIGELSRNFDLFMDKLQIIIKEVSISAKTILSSGKELNQATGVTIQSLEQISSTITEIAAGTSDAAAVAKETNTSLSEAARFSKATSNASKNTADNSKKAKEIAEEGAEKISEVVSSITDIAASSMEVSSIINELDNSSKKIGDIIEIITGISAQTNLLALNAAIEAARAGEAGRGFSVVADEIRKLADESNSAAQEISNLVKENQLKSNSAVNSVSEVEKKVSVGVAKASEVGKSIENIIENIKDIVSKIEEIDIANEEQARSTKEIESAMSNIASTSSEIASGTENISASIEEQLSTMTEIEKTTGRLSEMAKKLDEITSGFRV
ncbi:HAMP domain-containing protein [Clostridium bovifaecis]|uniref:HAMP domain-containing protein n=1 Tax=Clostridium bovifaecis TaxID=2184719 RepID=A0A6I6F8J7_9CLOT|nr:HAMP domain-containing protein [Clostridium bovifaecis]